MILALDLGTKTGWAFSHPHGIESGTKNLSIKKGQGSGERFLNFRRWLECFDRPDSVFYEEVRNHKGTQAAHVYGGMVAILMMWCEENKVSYSGVPVGTIKKHATSRGDASKTMMIIAARNLGFDPCDDNEADAIHILNYAMKGGIRGAR
mgnify:CR=1 FL=1